MLPRRGQGVLEPWNWLLSLIALGVAVYALIVAHRAAHTASHAQSVSSPLDQWEDEIASLTAELGQAAQQVVAQLSAKQEELQALLERAEQAAIALSAPTAAVQATETVAEGETPALDTIVAPEKPSSAMEAVDEQIRRLAAEGVSAAEIALRTKLPREEITLRLRRLV